MKPTYLKLLLIFLLAGTFSACKGTKQVAKAAKAYTPAGDWAYLITGTPDGDVEGTMMIASAAEGFTGKLVTDQGEVDLENIKIVDNVMTATFNFQGYDIDISGTFAGEEFAGNMQVAGFEMPIKATRNPKE